MNRDNVSDATAAHEDSQGRDSQEVANTSPSDTVGEFWADLVSPLLVDPVVAGAKRISEEITQALARLGGEIDDSLQRIVDLEDENRALRGEVTEMRLHINALDERLANLLGDQTRLRDDLTTGDYAVHLENAELYRNIVHQQVQGVARKLLRARVSSPPSSEDVAQAVAALCHQFFVPGESTTGDSFFCDVAEQEREHLIGELQEKAVSVRARAENAFGCHQWIVEFKRGKRIDDSIQEAWPSCDPNAPVKFMIAPGYQVDGRVYCRQVVFTARRNTSKRPT
jgi:hypothetical protein